MNSHHTSAVIHRNTLFILVGLCLAGTCAFVVLASQVLGGGHLAFDETLLLAMRNPLDVSDPLGPPWLEGMARDITALGSTLILALLTAAVAGHLVLRRKWRAVLFLVGTIGGGVLLNTVLKMGFDRPRPDLVPHGTGVYTASFPSAHAMLSTVVYLSLGVLLMRLESRSLLRIYIMSVAVALTLMAGISRIYLGVHWPSDVLAGWMAGATWALLCWLSAGFLQSRGKMEGQEQSAD